MSDLGESPTLRATKFVGTVSEAGGGYFTVFVDRNLDNYPELGARVYVESLARELVVPSPQPAEVLFGKIVSAVIDKLVAANVLSRDDVESGKVEYILDAIDNLARAAAVSPLPETET